MHLKRQGQEGANLFNGGIKLPRHNKLVWFGFYEKIYLNQFVRKFES